MIAARPANKQMHAVNAPDKEEAIGAGIGNHLRMMGESPKRPPQSALYTMA
jgi:hypothetical protein